MSIIPMLTQTASLYAPTIGANGRPGYSGTASSSGVKCRVEAAVRELRRGNDTVILCDATIFMDSSAIISEQYKVVVDTKNYIVEMKETVRNLTAVNHYELLCRGI